MPFDSIAHRARSALLWFAACTLGFACKTSREVVPCDPAKESACADATIAGSAGSAAPTRAGTSERAAAAGPASGARTSAAGSPAASPAGSTHSEDPASAEANSGDDAGAPPEMQPAARDPNALVGKTVPLAVMNGMYAKRYEREFYGTDLGWTFEHEGKLWVLFGDSWRTEVVDVTLMADDAFAQISLSQYPNGRAVEDWIHARPAAAGTPAWRAGGPQLELALTNGPGSIFAPTTLWRDGAQLYTGPGLTPMAGFSNGRKDSGAAAFGVFFRYAHVACEAGACASGFECDEDLGRAALEPFTPPCARGGSTAVCLAGPGFCQDRGSPMYDETESGRTKSIVVRHEVGSAVSSDPTHFDTRAWDTHRFFNLAARTVEDFDPARAGGRENAYQTASGSAPERDAVFLWGRPHFAGIGSEGRDAQVYFAWAPMPVRAADGSFDWQVHYYAGVADDGTPRFVEREVDSVPLDLDAAQSGEQPNESIDVVDQMTLSWLPEFQRWAMIYGGDIGEAFFSSIFRDDASKIRHDPRGALYVRFAEQPWGPWSAPRPLFTVGDRTHGVEAIDQYGPGGLLYHDRCQGPTCAGADRSQLGNNGVVYAPSIVEPWTEVRPGETDLYWFVSTWNPYQVVLMKSTLAASDLPL